MAIVLVLGGLAAAGYVLTTPNDSPDQRDFGTNNPKYRDIRAMNLRDIQDTGISTGTLKTSNLNVTNLNEAWKPRSAPPQKETRSLSEVYGNQADIQAYLAEYAHKFYFMKNGEIQLGSSQQNNQNIEIPMPNSSIRGDPGNSLTHYPRVYADYHGDGNNPHLFSNNPNTWNAGEPEEWSELWVPKEGQVNREWNPWGPGGVLQRLFNTRNERETRARGVDRSTVIAPPQTTYYNNIYG